jgi:predicted transcriptional regulator
MSDSERKREAEERQEKPPTNPQELIEALRKRGFKVNMISKAQLEARRQADLEMEGWHGKPKK